MGRHYSRPTIITEEANSPLKDLYIKGMGERAAILDDIARKVFELASYQNNEQLEEIVRYLDNTVQLMLQKMNNFVYDQNGRKAFINNEWDYRKRFFNLPSTHEEVINEYDFLKEAIEILGALIEKLKAHPFYFEYDNLNTAYEELKNFLSSLSIEG